ncbi:MAG TPA: hypothetical protein PKC77_16590, partial [Sphingopyxis sp.]|nr:hypothetical protein [Sphingopyxis sp.]
MRPTRRGFIAGSAALPLAAQAGAEGRADMAGQVAADLGRYIGFGGKASGGAGDSACGHWLADELEKAGFAVEKPALSVPWFAPDRCEIVAGDARAALWPQPIVVPTDAAGVTGPLVRVDAAGRADAPLAGAVALIDLPYNRWSSALAKPVRAPIEAAFAAGAKAAVVVTNGPT